MGKNTGKKYHVGLMEPMLPEASRVGPLRERAAELLSAASGLTARLHPIVSTQIGELVRTMNCYYSNLIEGHNTHPRDIERALAEHYSSDPVKRDLQLEAKAHIAVQDAIDTEERPFNVSVEYIQWLHAAFYQHLPEAFLTASNPDTGEILRVEPGQLRQSWVQVGRHIPPGPEELPNFMQRFSDCYTWNEHNVLDGMIAAAASHHRFLWIHPFLDGNGRVARLFSDAFLKTLGVGSCLWSVSRGLARHVDTYKAKLADADSDRRGDLDGRGQLSLQGLMNFCEFFMDTCLDQISFMDTLIQPATLLSRIEFYVAQQQHHKQLPKQAFPLLKEALLMGEFERGQAAALTGYQERQARTVLQALIEKKLLVSDSPRGKVRLSFSAETAEYWLPNLFPPGD